MKFISAVTSIGSLQYHSDINNPHHMMVSSGHMTGPVPSRLPQKRESRIPGPGIHKQVNQQLYQSNLKGATGRNVRTPSSGPAPPSSSGNCSNVHPSKSSMSDISSRRSSSPVSNSSSSMSLSRNPGSSSVIPGAPEIVINRRINTTDRQSNYSRPSIRPPRPTSIPSAPNHPSVATNGSIPSGHFSPAKLSQPVLTPRVDSCQKKTKNTLQNMGNVAVKGRAIQESNGTKKSEYAPNRRENNHQSSSPHQSNASQSSIQSSASSSSSSTSSPSSLPPSSPSNNSTPPHSASDRVNTDHTMSNKENSSFNSSGSNESHTKDTKSSNITNQNMSNRTGLSLSSFGGSSLPSSPAKIMPSGNLLSRTSSPGHSISHNYYNRTNEDFQLSVYSDSECSRKGKVNILYSYSPSARSNFPAISEIAGVIETSSSLSNNNSNLIANNSLLTKCGNKEMNQLESGSNFCHLKHQPGSNVNSISDRDRFFLNNSIRSSPIRELEASTSNIVGKCPSLRNLSNGQQSVANGSILTSIPSTSFNPSQQIRRLSKNSDLRGSAASLLSASSNFSSVSVIRNNNSTGEKEPHFSSFSNPHLTSHDL